MASRESLYLRPNIQVEPLVDQWYAWSYLIPPATAARNLVERHLKIMDSYINAPQVHAAAVKNPKMLGGPFMDYEVPRVDEIRALRDETKRRRAALIQLSAALGELDELLRSEAKGFSLQPLYGRVPAMLRGYVELIYDLNSNPSFRLVEPLLYRSPLHQTGAQTLMLSPITGDDRPFVLSTPRLASADNVHLRVAFDHEAVDALFRMKSEPRPLHGIGDLVGLDGGEADRFASYFSPQPPPPYQPYTGTGVRWRYFGHACILVETRGVSIVVDPVLSYTYDSQVSRYTYQDLPEHIDYVLITHNHQDHVLFETLLQIRHKVGCIVVPRNGGGTLQDPSLRLLLQSAGFRNVIDLGELEELAAAGVTITGLPFFGEHADLDVRSKLAYLVRTQHHSLVFAADSCNVEPALYEHLGAAVGKADALFVGMECDGAPLTWLYGPLLTKRLERAMDESRRLAGSNCEQAMKLVEVFRCREVYVYAMGQEPWLNYVMSIKYTEQSRPIVESDRLLQQCAARGIVAERLFGEKEILVE
ncbi:MAG TPA: MBL fold metallo-hydrolase [Thermoanaerobaculia bacterium]|nr:MBL fold metallo-hydrolase [Thermoanaerobaculia bacterium]